MWRIFALVALSWSVSEAAYCHGHPDPNAKPNTMPIFDGSSPTLERTVKNGKAYRAGPPGYSFWLIHVWGTAYEVRTCPHFVSNIVFHSPGWRSIGGQGHGELSCSLVHASCIFSPASEMYWKFAAGIRTWRAYGCRIPSNGYWSVAIHGKPGASSGEQISIACPVAAAARRNVCCLGAYSYCPCR